MCQNQSPTLLMVALLLFAAAAPWAHADLPVVRQLSNAGNFLTAATVMGSLCCAPNGHCPDGPPVAGATFRLICTTADGRSNVTVGEGLTGSNGAYLITVRNLNTTELGAVPAVIGRTVPCTTVIALPLSRAACPVLSTATGFLAGATTLVNAVPSEVYGVVGCLVGRAYGFLEGINI